MVTRRGLALALALAATVAATLFDPAEPPVESPVEATTGTMTGTAKRTAAASTPDEESTPLARWRHEPPTANLFPPGGWQPPSPPAATAVVAPKAPPLPFRYLGRLLDGPRTVVFLGQGPRTHLVQEGDLIADYRAERVDPRGMTLLYLPLNEKQFLTFGSQN